MNNYDTILELEPYTMIDVLTTEYLTEVPNSINTIEDMNLASQKLLKLSASYSFITSLLSYVKISTRDAKREVNKADKEWKDIKKAKYEDLVDKKEIIANIAESIKQQYSAISRAVTIHIENNKELNMAMR